MQKLITATLLLFILVALQTKAFAASLNCTFKENSMVGIHSLQVSNGSLIINKDLEIPLEKSRVKCGHFGKQTRFDGSALGFQIVLKSCTSNANFEGHIIDDVNDSTADIACQNSI